MEDVMKVVRLGKTGLQVSRIGFGGIPIQRLTEEEAIQVVRHSLDLGVTFIDTANGYTTSEERIGEAVAGRRDEVIIATKTGARDKETAQAHLELSLQRLKTDYLDLWQFHGVSTFETLERVLGPGGAMETAQEARRAGKVRHIGITSHSMEVALRAVPTGHFETMQFPFNYITNEAAQELIPLCREHDLGFIAMKPFGGGLLDKANLSIKYLLQFEGVVPDPGIEQAREIAEIVEIVRGVWEMSAQERQELEQIRAEVGTRFCRRCQYCLPCPEEVQISTVLNVRSFWRRFPPERFLGGGIARAVDSARNCVECGECEGKCPYHLPIIEMLAEHVAFFDSLTV
jgi:predicted aldo/keto reductase-like oxidoreductase